MAAGLGLLRLSPEAFWALTLPELAIALRGALGLPAKGGSAPEAHILETLMQLHPDDRQV
jgi:uncharacterized phage protein (TIGR02216 family)